MKYNAIVTLGIADADEAWTDRVLGDLEGFSPAIGWDNGRVQIVITVEAVTLDGAAHLAIFHVQEATDIALTALEVLPTVEFDARNETPAVLA